MNEIYWEQLLTYERKAKVIKKTQKGRLVDIIDLQSIFLCLLLVGQRRMMTLEPLFKYELCSVPPSLVDQYGCLRKSNKSKLVTCLGVYSCKELEPEIIIVDAQQLLYHVTWPHVRTPTDLMF